MASQLTRSLHRSAGAAALVDGSCLDSLRVEWMVRGWRVGAARGYCMRLSSGQCEGPGRFLLWLSEGEPLRAFGEAHAGERRVEGEVEVEVGHGHGHVCMCMWAKLLLRARFGPVAPVWGLAAAPRFLGVALRPAADHTSRRPHVVRVSLPAFASALPPVTAGARSSLRLSPSPSWRPQLLVLL